MTKMLAKKRIGDMEVRQYMNDLKKYEIIKWCKNSHYHNERFVWDEKKQMYVDSENPFVRICSTSYESKEFCYVITFLREDSEGGWSEDKDLSRYINLNPDDKQDYNLLMEYFCRVMCINMEDVSEEEIENPIIDNRIVHDKTFATRFKSFLKNVTVNDLASEEELEYFNIIADKLLAYQKATAFSLEEKQYFENLK